MSEKLDMTSPDLVNENFEKLAALFPNCVTESANGKAIDFDLLKQELSHDIIEGNKERYRLEWPGKREAIVTANLPTTKTLRPIREDSVDFDTTENSGRYHSDWLTMMYPRLKLARNLLTDDGVIFISIGEQEVHNLRKVSDEIFGSVNFIGGAGRISKKANNQGDYWAPNFDHVLTYSKNREFCVPFFGGINYKAYTEIETDGPRKGEKYQLVRLYMTSLDPMRGCNNQRYFVECPDGSFIIPPGEIFPEEKRDGAFIPPSSGKDKVWRWSYKSYLEKKDQLVVKKVRSSNLVNENGGETFWNVYTKTFLNDVIEKSTATPNNFIENHINQSSSHELKKLDIPFDFAKPSSLIKFLMETCRVSDNDIVLDFFSGFASSAQAVLAKSSEDKKPRKFIMVQLPEINEPDSDEYKAGYENICEIGKERIRRAAKKIKEETKAEIDYGFRVYRLDESNMQDVYYKPQDYDQGQLDAFADNVKPDRSSDDLLAQILLDWGLPLSLPIEQVTIAGKHVFKVASNSLFACFDTGIDEAFAKAVAQEKPLRIVFKDSGFKNDTAKENVKQLLKQLSPDTEMKVL